MRNWRLWIASLTLVSPGPAPHAPREAVRAQDALAESYAWGVMVLSFKPIYDLAVFFEDENGVARASEQYPGAGLLASFLRQSTNTHVGLGVAALLFELEQNEAGFKKADDQLGSIQPIPWNEEQVHEVARLCHDFLQDRQSIYALPAKDLSAGMRLLSSPRSVLVDEVTFCSAWDAFLSSLEGRERELVALDASEPELSRKVRRLHSEYRERQGNLRAAHSRVLLTDVGMEAFAYTAGGLDEHSIEILVGGLAEFDLAGLETLSFTAMMGASEDFVSEARERYVNEWRELLAPFDVPGLSEGR